MKTKHFYQIVVIALLLSSCSFLGNSVNEEDLIGIWTRPIESGMVMTIKNEDGTESKHSTGPISDEFMRFNADQTFQMWEKPRSNSPNFYNSNGTWKIGKDKKSVDVFVNGSVSNIKIKETAANHLTTISVQGNDLVFTRVNE